MTTANSEPWCLHQSKLESWYNENIQHGTTSFGNDCCKAVNDVVLFLQGLSKTQSMFGVREVIESGSLGKGTKLKDLSDIDLVVFIDENNLPPICKVGSERYQMHLENVLVDLEKVLKREKLSHYHMTGICKKTFLVQFTVTVGARSLKVDLLPTADNVPSDKDMSAFFETMVKQTIWEREFYSVSFVKNQLEFVKKQPGCVKELIRLVKYWAYKSLPDRLRKSYPLELITIFRWQRAGRPESFSKAQGLRDVLLMLTGLKALRTYWRAQFYSKELANTVINKLWPKRPVMLDPVNPTNNVCAFYHEDDNLHEIKMAARKTLRSELLKGVIVRRRQHWC